MQNEMAKSDIRELARPVLRPGLLADFLAAQRGSDVTIPDEDYSKEFPVPESHEYSTCKCGEKYDLAQFIALPIPQGSAGTWFYPPSEVELAVRECKCGNRIARRVV